MRRHRYKGRARSSISKFMSYLRFGRPWIDAHLPLVPVSVRSGGLALPNQRAITDFHESTWRTPSESHAPYGGVVDWSDLIRGAS